MDDRLEGLFLIDDASSEERYALEKIIAFKGDGHDVLVSPFLDGLKKLPVWRYYRVDDGEKDIDMISYDAYGTLFYAWLIQYYNDTIDEVFQEGTVLSLFNETDLEELYRNISAGELEDIS